MKQIGTVELLVRRIYTLDPTQKDNPLATEVVVQPGTFPVFREADAIFWSMTGQINGRGCQKIGDGLFEMNSSDSPRGPEVVFPSPTFGRQEFAKLLTDIVCRPGPQQRLRFDLQEEL